MPDDIVRDPLAPFGIVQRAAIERCMGDTTAVAVYAVLATYAGPDGDAFPFQSTMFDLLGISESTLRRALKRLRAAGLVTSTPRLRRGRKVGNRYTVHRIVGTVTDDRSEDAPERSPVTDRQPVTDDRSNEQTTDQPTLTRDGDPSTGDRFDEWWALYPRREAKKQAHKAWRSALKRVDDVEVLFAAVRVYAERVAGSERRFIAMAATWLNGDRWEDNTADRAIDDDEYVRMRRW